MQLTNIYILIDPLKNDIRYVGKANDIKQRYKAHLNPARYKDTHIFRWIKKLRYLGQKPTLEVIEQCDKSVWKQREKYWIKYYKKLGYNLVNYTDGGDGLTFGNKTSFKKGHKLFLDRKHTEVSKKKISQNSYTKGKPALNRKRVLQKNLDGFKIKEWDCITNAAEFTNSNRSKISACCKKQRKTHNGFIWEYLT